MDPPTNRVKVRIYFYGLIIEINNFAFDINAILGPESTLLGGWVALICETITNLASAGAEVEARLSLATILDNRRLPLGAINPFNVGICLQPPLSLLLFPLTIENSGVVA